MTRQPTETWILDLDVNKSMMKHKSEKVIALVLSTSNNSQYMNEWKPESTS